MVGSDTGGAVSQLLLDEDREPGGSAGADQLRRVRLVPAGAVRRAVPGGPAPGAGHGADAADALELPPAQQARLRRAGPARGSRPTESRPWVTPYLTDAGVRRDVTTFAKGWDPDELVDAARWLETFDKPVLLCWAPNDPFFKYDLAKRLLATFPDATLVEFRRRAHLRLPGPAGAAGRGDRALAALASGCDPAADPGALPRLRAADAGATRASTSRPRPPIGPERSGSATRSISARTASAGLDVVHVVRRWSRGAAGVEGHASPPSPRSRRARCCTSGRASSDRVSCAARRRRRDSTRHGSSATRVPPSRCGTCPGRGCTPHRCRRPSCSRPSPEARVSGSVRLGDRSVELDDWPAMVGHNWGTQHAERWIWLQGALFDGRGRDTWLDVALGRIKVGAYTTPWIANGALSLDGRRHRIGGIGKARATKVVETPEGCEFTLPGTGITVRGRVSARRQDLVGWVYADPDGSEHDTVNCSIADLERRREPRWVAAAEPDARPAPPPTSSACARRTTGSGSSPSPITDGGGL